jgi:hypothetical protein
MKNQTLLRSVLLCCTVASCVIVMASSPASAVYSTSGRLEALMQSPYASVDRLENTGTENLDSEFLIGDNNGELRADYIVSLPQGRMDAYLKADGGDIPYEGVLLGWSNGRIESTFSERIDFTVPAGSYPEGVTVHLDASLVGELQASHGAPSLPSADANFYFSFALSDYEKIVVSDHFGPIDSDDPVVGVDEDLSGDLILIHPGTNLAQEATLYGSFSTSFTVLVRFPGLSTAGGIAVAELDLSVNSLTTSDPTVTWTSESGVFLTPEPGLALLQVVSLLILVLLRSRRR